MGNELADTFGIYFGSAYPILPQPEPNFDIRQFDLQDLSANPVFRELRTFLFIADLGDERSPVTQMVLEDIGKLKIEESMGDKGYGAKVGKDKWARGQLILYLYGENIDKLKKAIEFSYPAFTERIREFDKTQIDATVYLEGLNMGLINQLKEDWGVEMRIPKNFVKAREGDDFLWLRYEQPKTSSSLFFYRVSYDDSDQMSEQGLKRMRDSVLGPEISSTVDSTFVVVNDEDLPLFHYQRRINDQYASELRGIWEMQNDFLGGPFQNFAILDEARGELLLIDAFIYAPGEDKRDLMQKLEHIVETAKLTKP